MGAISGKGGTVLVGVAAIAHVTKWTFEGSASIPKWNSNTSDGTKDATCGPKDSKGTIDLKLDDANGVPWGVGELVTLILMSDKNTAGDSLTVTAYISTTPLECDIDGGEPIAAKYAWEGKGAWTGLGVFANV